VIIDEAHFIEFNRDEKALQDLREAENRALRLESLGMRLFTYLSTKNSRAMALSAVASKMEIPLASWVKGEVGANAEKTFYRSTRQLIGRLECLSQNRFEIRYDLLDGASLKFDLGDKDTPFIPNPVPPYPQLQNSKVSGTRPYLFWAAMQLAKPDEQGLQHTILISVTQNINGYARDFLEVLNIWQKDTPHFFQPPEEGSFKWELWNNCLKSCKDYFTDQSHEYHLCQTTTRNTQQRQLEMPKKFRLPHKKSYLTGAGCSEFN
jgi:hypothetical protein